MVGFLATHPIQEAHEKARARRTPDGAIRQEYRRSYQSFHTASIEAAGHRESALTRSAATSNRQPLPIVLP
jgi:hypothetical protein